MQSDAARRVLELVDSYWATQAISTACELGFPEQLADGPKSAATLAAEAQAHAPAVERLMRALQVLELTERLADGSWRLTPAGQVLRADAEESVHGRARFAASLLWRQLGDLMAVVRSGERSKAIPASFADFPPELTAVFQKAMAESSQLAARHLTEAFDASRFQRMLDVGGGHGGMLAAFLRRHPDLTGAVLDLPFNAEGARALFDRAGVADRAEFIGGDFFQHVPEGYDAYHLKFILHDWGDEPAVEILRNIRAAAGPDARLLVVEQIVPETLQPTFEHRAIVRSDLVMLGVEGKERTRAEYAELLRRAGFAIEAITGTQSSFSIIEARPV